MKESGIFTDTNLSRGRKQRRDRGNAQTMEGGTWDNAQALGANEN
jgi:hypothetical protein